MKKRAVLFLFLALAACKDDGGRLNGYVEGEFLRIAPTSSGVLADVNVARGQAVKAGDPLFTLDITRLDADRESALAELAQAEARLKDLTKGKRPEEIAVIFEQKAQALASLQNAAIQLQRSKELIDRKVIAKAKLDEDRAAYDVAEARVAELDAQLKAAGLGGRADEIVAAEAAVTMMTQKLAQAEKLLQEAAPVAPSAARIEEVYYRPGEYVAAGAPVISLLPPENIKIRFFAGEAMLPRLHPGQKVRLDCDGCTTPVAATISFIASEAEFTPPVIYSVGSRDKLVFMVEATPDAFDAQLRPGLPVDITLEPHE